MAHYRDRPGLGFVQDGKEWDDEEVAALLFPYHSAFWICDMMEAQAFVFTYSDLQEIPGTLYDRIRHIQAYRARVRTNAERA
jgi:hypothetical protein